MSGCVKTSGDMLLRSHTHSTVLMLSLVHKRHPPPRNTYQNVIKWFLKQEGRHTKEFSSPFTNAVKSGCEDKHYFRINIILTI